MSLKALVEAAIFLAEKPISLEKLAEILDEKEENIRNVLEDLKKEYSKEERGLEIFESKDGIEIRVKPKFLEKIKKVAPLADLSQGTLRTLSLIALNQPVKQSTLVSYQGNKAYSYIKELEKKGLINCEKFGRTKIISISKNFEKYFGIGFEEFKRKLEEMIRR